MRRNLFFMISAYLMEQYNAQIHCRDIHQQIVSQGLHYIPGTNPCTLCVCDKGSPKWCKSVLCAPPQNCKSFQVGTLCCEFKCLDDILTAHDDTYDIALRFIASAVTAILSLSLLFFLFHRLKRRKGNNHQNQQMNDDQRSLNSIGYITGSLGYLPDGIGYLGSGSNDIEYHYEESSPQYCLWKPPSNYFPQGEAPPPYEEAIRSAQLENDIINSQIRLVNTLSNSLSQPRAPMPLPVQMPPPSPIVTAEETQQSGSNSSTTCRHDYANDNQRRQYVNVIVENVTVHSANDRKTDDGRQKSVGKSSGGNKNDGRNTYENIPLSTKPTPKRDRAMGSGNRNHNVETYDYLNLDKPIVKIGKYDVIVENGGRLCSNPNGSSNNNNQSVFNVPERFNAIRSNRNCCDYPISSSKSLNRELSKSRPGERSEHNLRSLLKNDQKEMPSHRTLPKNIRELLANAECFTAISDTRQPEVPTSAATSRGQRQEDVETAAAGNLADVIAPAPPNFASPLKETGNKSKDDDQLSLISYRCLSSSPDDEDYRSECENCKSAGFTIPDGEEEDVLNETMTLQRRPQEVADEVPYYRTSLTLPTNSRNTRKSRAVVTNSTRENWFTSMRETSSSDEGD